MTVIRRVQVGTARGWQGPLDVYLEGSRISRLDPATRVGEGAGDRFLIPGFLDLHVHGGGGYDFLTADRAGIRDILATHLAGGTTALLATVVAAGPDQTRRALENILSFAPGGTPLPEILGVHWESPLLNPGAAGAQEVVFWPIAEIKKVVEDYFPWIKIITLAPEMPGALSLISWLVERGVIVSLGHSRATWAEFSRGVVAGARRVTHLFNAMRPWHHREPGIAGGALLEEGLVAELLADPAHLHPQAGQMAYRLKGSQGLNLVSDATAAAGMPDGTYHLGRREVKVTAGQARLTNGRLAGSTLTMRQAATNAIRWGIPREAAIQMAALVPARSLGQKGRGEIAPGQVADLLLVDGRGQIAASWVRGQMIAY